MDAYLIAKLLLITCLLAMTLSLVIWSLRLGITPTPTSPAVKRAVAQLLPQAHQVTGEIHELGSGWGTLLPLITTHYPHHDQFAHERSPIPRYTSVLTARLFHSKAIITGENIFGLNLSNAGLIICYLYTGAMKTLSAQLQEQLPPHCWVVSHTFQLPDWEPVQTLKANDIYRTSVYLYRRKRSTEKHRG